MEKPNGIRGLVRASEYDDYEKDIRNQIRIRNAMFEAGYGEQLEALEKGEFNREHYNHQHHNHAANGHDDKDESPDPNQPPPKPVIPVPSEVVLKVDENISGEDWNLLKITLPGQLIEGKHGVSVTSVIAPWVEATSIISELKSSQLVCPWNCKIGRASCR